MKTGIFVLLTILLFSACQSNRGNYSSPNPTQPTTVISLAPGPISINSLIPYQNENAIQINIRQECNLGQQLSEYITSHAGEQGIAIHRVNQINPKGPGNVLVIEITNAISMGNAFIGHSKATSVQGKLYENGTLKGGFTGGRRSMGGVFAGFKGSCSVLDRTVKVLGEDIARWLKHPTDNARLGDQ